MTNWLQVAESKLQQIDAKFNIAFQEYSNMYRMIDERARDYSDLALSWLTTGDEQFRGDNLVSIVWDHLQFSEQYIEPEKRCNRSHIKKICDVLRTIEPDTARKLQSKIIRQGFGFEIEDDDQEDDDFLSIDDFLNLPESDWQVRDLLFENSLGFVYGEPNTCKSFFSLHMALCIATGISFFGRETKQGNVLYVLGEGGRRFGYRIKAWFEYHKLEFPKSFKLRTQEIDLTDPKSVNRLIKKAKKDELNYDFIVIDTLNQCSGVSDENSQKDMTAFTNGCKKIQTELETTCLVIHHSGKDKGKGMRGSSALNGNADTTIGVEKKEDDSFTIKCYKQKDDTKFNDFHLEFESVLKSVVLVESHSEIHVEQKEKKRKLSPTQIQILDILSQCENGLTGPQTIDLGIKKSSFYNSLNGLISLGRVREENGVYYYISRFELKEVDKIEIVTKLCKHCGNETEHEEVRKGDFTYTRCKVCVNDYAEPIF